jgi:type II secretory pathway component PulM
MSLQNLEPREKKVLAGGVAAAALILGYLIITSLPAGGGDTLKQTQRVNEQFQQDLREYQALRGVVEAVDRKLAKTPAGYDLFGTLNNIVQELQLGSDIKAMVPHDGSGTDYYDEKYVDMTIQGVNLDNLVQFLQKLDAEPAFLRVTQVSITKRFSQDKSDNGLDVSIRIAAYAKKEAPTPVATGPAAGKTLEKIPEDHTP